MNDVTVVLSRKELEFLTSLLNDVPHTYDEDEEKGGYSFFQDNLNPDEFSNLTNKFESKSNN